VPQASITGVESVGTDTLAVEIEPPDSFDGRPGQFVLLKAEVDGTVEQSHYTISSPADEDRVEITVGVDPDGDLGPWLVGADSGTEVTLDGPFGETYYDGEGDVVLLAGGPGVGPAVGIAESALRCDSTVTVVYYNDTVAHAKRLERLAEVGATVHLVDEPKAYAAAVAGAVPAERVFVFGFAEFVAMTETALEPTDIDMDALAMENFGPE
jgi:ferredoxin-NADP reductase